MIGQGLIQSVQIVTAGSYLAADAALAATSLVLESVLDFSTDGGQLTLNGVTYTYTAANYDTDTLTLSTGLTGAAVVTDRVDVSPLSTEKIALVTTAGPGDAVTARIPHALVDRVPEGIREPGDEESVQYSLDNGEFIITDIVGRQPVVDGSYIDETTLPPAPSDGLAPASSPTPTVLGGIRQLFLLWTPITNSDAVTYDVHMSTTAAFTAGPSTLIGSTEGTTFVIQIANPDYTISYYTKIIARDADGSAPVGTEVATMLVAINSPDLAANAVRANNILVGELRASHASADFFESGDIQTASSGRRVRIGVDGIQLLDSDDSLLIDLTTVAGQVNSFYGALQTTSLTSLDSFEMRGTGNSQGVGSSYTLASGITASASPPTATVGYPMAASLLDAAFFRTKSVDWGSTNNFYVRKYFGDSELLRQTVVGNTFTSFDLDAAGMDPHGAAICFDTGVTEDRAYILARDTGSGVWKIFKYDLTAWPSPTLVTTYTWTHDTGVDFFPPNIGRDFTADNFITAEVLANQTQIRFRRYAAINGALISTTTTSSGTSALSGLPDKSIRGVARGSFGLGAVDYYMVALPDRVWFFDPTTGALISSPGIGPSFFSNGNQQAFQWSSVESKFKGFNNDDTQLTTYTDWNVTGNHTDAYQAAYTWATATAETTMSAQKAFTMKKRGQVTLATPAIPGGGPDRVRFYLGGPSATPLARTSMWDQSAQPAVGVTSKAYQTLRVATGGGAVNPPLLNNFPTAAPATIKDGAGNVLISGDGTFPGRMLTQNLAAACSANVALTSTEVDITGASVTFTTTKANATYLCTGSFYFSANGANTSQAFGKLSVDGTVQTAFAGWTGLNTVPDRSNGSQTWTGTLASAGSHTLKLRGVLAGTGVTVNQTHTTITVMVFE